MTKKKVQWIMTFLITGILLQSFSPSPVTAATLNDNKEIVKEAQTLVPLSIQMIDQTVTVLSKGWHDLSSEERILLNDIYDPGDTGEIDQAFVDRMHAEAN